MVAWNVDGSRLASASADASICVWPTPTTTMIRNPEAKLGGHRRPVEHVTWSPIRIDELASVSSDKTLRRWDLRRPQKFVAEMSLSGEGRNLAWSPDEHAIAAVDHHDVLTFFDARMNQVMMTQKYRTAVGEICWDKGGTRFFIGKGDGTVDVVNWPEWKVISSLPGHTGACFTLDYDPNFDLLVVGGEDGLVTLWDLDEYFCIRLLDHSDEVCRAVRFSHNGRLVASGTEGSSIQIVETSSGHLIHQFTVKDTTNSVNWHPKRDLLAYAGETHEGAQVSSCFIYGLTQSSVPAYPGPSYPRHPRPSHYQSGVALHHNLGLNRLLRDPKLSNHV